MNKNKIGSILAASAILCATSTVTAHAQDMGKDNATTLAVEGRSQNSTAVVVNCPEGLNLRKGPSTNDIILRLLPNGAKLEVLSSSNGWTKIKYDGIYGYVYSTYIKVNSATTETTMSATGKVVNTSGLGLNLRSSASTSSSVLATIKEGTSLSIKAKNGAWYKVSHSGKTGYVHSDYIQLVQSNTSQGNNNTTTETAFKSDAKVVNTSGVGLNLRSAASTSSSVIATLKEGTKLSITAKNGVWYKVNYNGKAGYVHSSYVELIKESTGSNNTNTGNGDVAFSSAGYVGDTEKLGLIMRTGPSTSSSVVLTMPEGATLSIIAKNGAWYKVTYGGKTGYAHSDYIVLGNKPSTNTPVTPPSNNAGNGDVDFSSAAYVSDTSNLGLFMRAEPKSNATILTTIPEGATINVIAKNGAWYKVSYNGKTGYSHSDYITLGNKPSTNTPVTPPSNNTGNGDVAFSSAGYVGDTERLGLLMRTGPSTSSSVILTIPEGATLTVVAKNGSDWYKVTYAGKTGYAHSEYIILGSKPSAPSAPTATFEAVYNVMKAHIGTPYVWGGSGEYITDSSIANLKARFPYEAADGWYNYIGREYYNKGYRAFDCSGLMQWGFAQVGISIGRTTYTQVNAGVGVSIANAQPGDLLITRDQGHVGMYLGNGQWIESPAPGYSIRISNVNWNSIGYVRRVL